MSAKPEPAHDLFGDAPATTRSLPFKPARPAAKAVTSPNQNDYGADAIEVWKGLSRSVAVPACISAWYGREGRFITLFAEVIDNAMDEAVAGTRPSSKWTFRLTVFSP